VEEITDGLDSAEYMDRSLRGRNNMTRVVHESLFQRLGGAVKGVVAGAIMIVIAFPLLFLNEGRAVNRYKTLKEGGGAVISVSADGVEPVNDGKLVHVTGRAITGDVLTDPVFGISAGALKMKRVVEMYQWKEKSRSRSESKTGGSRTTTTMYSYSRVWSEDLIPSENFDEVEGHENPEAFPFSSMEMIAEPITVGAFTLPESLVRKIRHYESFPVGSDFPVPEDLAGSVRLHDSGFYIGEDPGEPRVGDTRIRFETADPADVSIIACQVKDSFEPYAAQTGGTIELLETGIHSADAMIQSAQEKNKALTLVLRIVGFAMMFIGLLLILKPLSVAADILPIAGRIIGAGTGIIGFFLAAFLSLATIAVAWIFYRPLLGGLILIVAVGSAAVVIRKLKSAKPVKQTA